MEIKKLTKEEVQHYFTEPELINKLPWEIMGQFNKVLDTIINNLDTSLILNQFAKWTEISAELEMMLSEASTPSTGILGFFTKKKEKPSTIGAKCEKIMSKYKESLTALKQSVWFQMAQGKIMDEYLKYFSELEWYIAEIIETIEPDTMSNKIIKSAWSTLLTNIRKMNVSMDQKMAIMQTSIMSSMWLKEEMETWLEYFNWMIKQLLISMSMQWVVESASDIISWIRKSTEKFNDIIANKSIETANAISEIRENWIISTRALLDMGQVVNKATSNMVALNVKREQQLEQSTQALTVLQSESQTLKALNNL